MRPVERINNFLNKVSWSDLAIKWNLTHDLHQHLYLIYKNFFDENYDNVIKYWKENSDQRIGQVLINLGVVPDNLKIWNDEEDDILLDQGFAPEEVLFWGRNYDKDMNLLPKTEYILIKNLDSDHINSIYDYVFKRGGRLSEKYMIAFKNTLKSREESTSHIEAIELWWKMEKEMLIKEIE